jgi:hypothetical protein
VTGRASRGGIHQHGIGSSSIGRSSSSERLYS